MARNNDLVVTAGLNIEASVNQIEKDLKQVSEKLAADHALKIIANIDLGRTTQRIQSQLATISKNLNLDVGGLNLNASNVTSDVAKVVNSVQKVIGTGFKADVNINSGAIENVGEALKNLGLDADNVKRLTEYLENLDVVITKIAPKFVKIDGMEKQVLDSLSIRGIDKNTGSVVNITEQLDEIEGKTAKTTVSITQNLAKVEQENKKIEDSAKAAQLAYNDFLKLKGQADVYSKQYAGEDSLKTQLTDIQKLIGEFDNTQPLEKQREGIINIDNALKLLKVDIDNIKKASTPVVTKGVSDFYPNIAKGTSTQDTISNAKNTLNELFAKTAGMEEDTANRVKRAVEDTTGALKTFYVQVERGDKSVETLTYALNEQGNAYEYLGKTIREADNSTDFRRKDITTQWDIQTQKLQQFITNAEKAGAASTVLSDDIVNLKNKLNDKGDTSAMNSFLDDFDIAKAKFQAFNAEARKDNALANLQNRIKRLAADINSYAAANKRAVESTKQMSSGRSFADEWSRITTEMAKGADLTDDEVRQLTADLRVFGKEAKANALDGANAFEKFGNAFKLISTYISANQIINMITRQIREAVTELQKVDDILTEISKTSDRTNESLKKLGDSSFDRASKYGRTASDYLLGVQEMSRAGFGETESENLAELSILAQAAGDMTAEMANEYIIATNAAYKLNGNEAELNKILDSQNYITNHNALNMENLAEATKLAASQAASAGVETDKLTAAIGTMVAVTQQGGAQAGRAFRGILMNLQQVKATATEIGDEGEDITASSLSKYEKAVAALGVSMKEIKNGAISLRNPMEILKDLSEAVKKESEGSIKVANLLSAVGGKYRANQLNALLTNWDMYEKMLSEYNSVEAVGSAMEEANKSANNWTGSINKLKNSWAKLVNQFVNSDDVVMVVQELDKAIQDLSSSETVTGIKTVISSIMQLFSVLVNLKNTLTSIPLLGDVFEHTFGNITGLGLGTFKSIGKIVDFFNKGEKEAEKLRVKQEELRESYISNIQIYDEEVQTVNKLIGEYTNLISNSENVIDIKDSLLDIQKQLIEKYGEEANGIDLVNNSIQENIDKLIELQRKKNEIFLNENKEAIQNAYDWFGIGEGGVSSNNINTNNAQLFAVSDITSGKYEEAEEEADKYFTEIEKYIKERYGKVADNIDFKKVGEGIDAKFVASIKEGLTSDEITKSIDAITDAYKSVVTDSNFFNSTEWLESVLVPWQEIARKNNSIIQDALEKSGFNKEAEDFEKSDAFEKYNSLISKAIELNQKFSKSNNLGIKTGILAELDDVKSELKEIASEYPIVNELIQEQIGNLGNIFATTSDNIELAKEIWNESLEEIQKGTLANVDKITAAIQKMYSGKALGNKDAWEILGLDDGKLLSNISIDANGEYVFQVEQLVALKDELIRKEIEEHQLSLSTAQENIRIAKDNIALAQDEIERIKNSNMGWREKWQAIKNAGKSIESYQMALSSYIFTEKNESLIISELSKKLGDLSNNSEVLQAKIDGLKKSLEQLKEELSTLNKEADARLKAQEYVLDNIIDGHKKELETLEKEKEALEEQLEALEKQKSETEEIIDNYKTVADVVTSAIEKEIKSIEDERDSIEEYYDEQINKLKKANEEREDAIEYEQKLANLANAQNNKVRVYDQERGWTYETNKEELKKAQDDLKSFETNQRIKDMEKQKETATQGYDERIKALQDYADQWTEAVNSVTDAENELLAQEILGSDWREKITKQDLITLNKFKTGFTNYNTKLKNLVDTEIASMNKSIEAKDKDIKAKQEQVKAWEEYRTKVEETAKTIKDGLEEYNNYLSDVGVNEKSTNEERQKNLENFATKYKELIDEITKKNSTIEETEKTITGLTEAMNDLNKASSNMTGVNVATNTGSLLGGISGAGAAANIGTIINNILEKLHGLENNLFKSIFHYANGGAADYTGLAWVDGTKTASETVFTAAQSKKLLSYVEALPNLGFKVFNGAGLKNNSTSNTQNVTFNGGITVVANNPEQFSDQMNRYIRTKLTQSKVN